MEKSGLMAIERPKTIVEKVVDQIQTLIAAGKLKPGDTLPVEYKLAKTFNIGNSTMREALKILETKGVLERIPRKGVVIMQLEQSHSRISITVKVDPRHHLELMECFRIYLASLTVPVCENRTEPQLAKFKNILDEIEDIVECISEGRTTPEAFEAYARLYMEYYILLGECTHNPVCEELLNAILTTLRVQGPIGEAIFTRDPELVRRSFAAHKQLIVMIENQDKHQAHKTALKALQRTVELASSALSGCTKSE